MGTPKYNEPTSFEEMEEAQVTEQPKTETAKAVETTEATE